MTPQEQLQQLFREVFQLENSDLDFGIYRILNQKRAWVEEFTTVTLPGRIEEVKAKIMERQNGDLIADLEQARIELHDNFHVDFGIEGDLEKKVTQYKSAPIFENSYQKYVETKKLLDALRFSEDTERSIYNELFRFFSRYYDGGDFISKSRAGQDNYMIPYNGEEVKLYWANHDQYYIKTADNFKNYIFTNGSNDPTTAVAVEFKLVDAQASINNNKEEKGRLFIPTKDALEWDVTERILYIRFEYRVPFADEKEKWGEKQNVKKEGRGINQRILPDIEKAVKKSRDAALINLWEQTRTNSKGEVQPLFLYHLNRYTDINTFDFFIHKDLREFLERELDYFLKHEVFSVNFLSPEWEENEVQAAIKINILKASTIRELALSIIHFLGELEDFQKRMYEKKKFVVQNDYCLSLNRISDKQVRGDIVHEILKDPRKMQINEWKMLGFIENAKEVKSLMQMLDDPKNRLNYLLVDTQFLSEKLKWKLLTGFDGFDAGINAILVNSDNWHALNFLRNRFAGRIDCNYMDPPFNSKTTDFVYKNSYKHSSWLTMMRQNLGLSKQLLSEDGVLDCAIDDCELSNLCQLLEYVFGEENRLGYLVIEIKPSGRTRDEYLATSHEYILVYARNKENVSVNFRELTEEQKAEYKFSDSVSAYKWRDFLRTGGYSTPEERPHSFYSIYYNPSNEQMSLEQGKGFVKIDPLDSDDKKRVWRKIRSSFMRHYDRGDMKVDKVNGEFKVKIKDRIKKGTRPKSVWVGPQYDAASHGTKLLKSLFKDSPFSFPKSLNAVVDTLSLSTDSEAIILDQFAGSGTTGHAVMELNRNDEEEGKRKCILVEMGRYFDVVTKARMEKVSFSDKWKDGKPDPEGKGISQVFQYFKLEQYEDTLNNIEFKSAPSQTSLMDQIRYQFANGTQGSVALVNLERFADPFNYTMKIVRLNEVEPDKTVDLVATFNFFLGIDVQQYILEYDQDNEYRIVKGVKRQQLYLIIWRRFVEGRLNLTKERDWITKLHWFDKDALIYCNADNAFGARSTETEFKRIMNEPVR
jgi:adenine-specific DNA-methyltransferase